MKCQSQQPMQFNGALLLRRAEVQQLLTLRECIDAVEEMFRAQGNGEMPAPGILGVPGAEGGLHVKAGLLSRERSYFVAKLNTNFPSNASRFSLPTIQGLIVLCDADNGRPLAVLDSIEVTIKRTAAASAVAAKFLARQDSRIATICGCGLQGSAQLEALRVVLPLEKIHLFDLREEAAQNLADVFARDVLEVEVVRDLGRAIRESDVGVTCTTSQQFIVHKGDVPPGTFIAAVGADNEHKQEIDPHLIASANVVVDNIEQCCTIGDLHHAIARGLTKRENVYAELSEVVAGKKPGRTSAEEIFIFDSTGIASEDAVAAVAIYEKARAAGIGQEFDFAA